MTKRRQPPTPANLRLDWRDPDMPVLGKSGREIEHYKMTIKAQLAMTHTDEPTWRCDPTYNLRRSKPSGSPR